MALDTQFLAGSYGLDEPTVSALLTAPTTDLVTVFLQHALSKAQELDILKAAKLQLDVELETTVRNSEAKSKLQKNNLTRQVGEISDLRAKINDADSRNEHLLTQIRELQSNASNTSTASEGLQQRIDSLERNSRETLAAVEIQRIAKDRLAKELEEQHSRAVTLQKEVSTLTEHNQRLQNELSSQTSREQIIKQELELCKKNNKWQADELTRVSTEGAQLRKDRNARVRELEREVDELSTTVVSLQQSETSLRQQLTDLQAKTEDAFTRNAELQEATAQAAQSFAAQIESTKRLAELHAQNAATHKARLEDVQAQLEDSRHSAHAELQQLQTEIEVERADKLQAEQTIADLELRLESQDHSSAPATPGKTTALAIPGSAQRMVRNLTNTQMYTQYIEAKQDLENEERRTAKLQAALDDLMTVVESSGPEVLELKQEQQRLEEEILTISGLLHDANSARDAAVKEAQHWEGECSANSHESDILRQQLRDASAQVKILLLESQSREHGLDDMSVQERLEVERAARGEMDGQMVLHTNSTQQLISERLVLFRNVTELQARNEQLIRLTREFGDKMEGEEAKERERQANAEEIGNLRLQLDRYKEEIQATATQISSYMKERDMFRRMLQHRGTLPVDADNQAMFGESLTLATPSRYGIEPATPRGREYEDVSKALREQQKFFDEFRVESAADRRTLKEQVDTLARDKNALQLEVARLQSQVTLSSDRYGLLQGNFTSLRTENAELQKRSQLLSENAAKQDLRTQQVAEELVEARSLADSLRAENANTKAEKDLWKRIEARLTEDNRNLMDERSRLSKLNTDLSNLANERERTENEARRRLQSHADSLDAELTTVKRKLEEEIESGKKSVLRREYEETQNRTRIDDLTKSLGYTREELAAIKTARDQLQSRVDELKIELRAAEEKAIVLQPRLTARSNGVSDAELSTEQQLAIQLSDAKRDLDLARGELDSAREQIEQYKTIAQTTEEELASFNQTSEQFREENDALLAEKDSNIKQLEQRVQDLTTELADVNTELSDLHSQHDNAASELASQRAGLEADLARLADDAARYDAEKKMYLDDVKVQAEIARQAQESYESELVKHAEAARSLQATRQELNTLRTEVAGIRADAEAARATLESGQESWSEQQNRLQREIDELNQRRIEVDAQNKLLHKQLETFSTELQALRQGRALPQADTDDVSGSAANLQEVIAFLRREKEIVEVQHELAAQETRRLQQQLDRANGQVDDLQFKLTEERQQSTDRAAAEASTSRLSQAINELNLFRESAVTLRSEARQARERAEEKDLEIARLTAELQPLQVKVAELEAEAEVKDSEVKLITSDRDHWRERTQNIISKYDRVDPAELEELKSRIAALQVDKATLEAEKEPLRQQITAAEEKAAELETSTSARINQFKEQAKNKAREQRGQITEITNKLKATEEELAQVKSQGSADTTGLSAEEIQALQTRLAEADAQASARTIEVEALQVRVTELEGRVQELTSEVEVARTLKGTSEEEAGEIVEVDETLAKAQQELATARQEIAHLKELHAAGPSATVDASAADPTAALAELEQKHQLAISQAAEATEAKLTKMRSNLSRQLQEGRTKIQEEARAELLAQHSIELQTLRTEYEKTIAELKSQHQTELAELQKADGTTQSEVKSSEPAAFPAEPSDEQINELLRSNTRVRSVMQASVKKHVGKETEKLSQALADKESEIETLKSAGAATTQDSGAVETAVREAMEKAAEEKDAAVRLAIDAAEKKTKVQLSQRDIALARINVVTKAASETPQRAVAEVWEEAKKAKPAAKPAVPAANGAAGEAKPDQAKLDARKERFGGGTDATTTDGPGTNPQAAPFVPGAAKTNGSGIPTASTRGRGGYSVRGAARGGRGASGAPSGQKRQHEGGGGGDGKRARGGGGP